MPSIDVRRAADRFTTKTERITSQHSFSFGTHYDPDNVRFGRLVAHNDEVVLPNGGYPPHLHQDVEIVTWILHGQLTHEDSAGNRGVLGPGVVQLMSAGRGVTHSERNDDPAEPLRFVQMWIQPDQTRLEPGYGLLGIEAMLAGGGLVPVVSGLARHTAALRMNNASAALHVARLPAGHAVPLPDAACVHVFIATGTALLEGVGALSEGDAVRITSAEGRRIGATAGGTEILVWEM